MTIDHRSQGIMTYRRAVAAVGTPVELLPATVDGTRRLSTSVRIHLLNDTTSHFLVGTDRAREGNDGTGTTLRSGGTGTVVGRPVPSGLTFNMNDAGVSHGIAFVVTSGMTTQSHFVFDYDLVQGRLYLDIRSKAGAAVNGAAILVMIEGQN